MKPEFEELQQASAAGDLDRIRTLLDAGVDLNADFGAPQGWSPLMHAAYHGHLEAVQLLVTSGAKLNAVEVDRWGTALDIAEDAGQTEVVEYLKSIGAPRGSQVSERHRGRPIRRGEIRSPSS